MNESEKAEAAEFAREVKNLNERFGGHYTICLFRQTSGGMFGELVSGEHASMGEYDASLLLTAGEAKHIREMRSKVTCELSERT